MTQLLPFPHRNIPPTNFCCRMCLGSLRHVTPRHWWRSTNKGWKKLPPIRKHWKTLTTLFWNRSVLSDLMRRKARGTLRRWMAWFEECFRCNKLAIKVLWFYSSSWWRNSKHRSSQGFGVVKSRRFLCGVGFGFLTTLGVGVGLFCPTPDVRLHHFLQPTPKSGIPLEMTQFILRLLLKRIFLAVHHDFHRF